MKLKNTALLASLTFFAAAVNAAPKKAPKPAAKPAVAAPAAPVAAAPAPAAASDAPAPVEGFFVKKVKSPVDGKEITLRLGGYVDAYYAYHHRSGGDTRSSNHPSGTDGTNNIGTGYNTGRIFETPSEQFSLGLIQTKFEMGNEDWQVVADLIHGPNAELTNFNNLRSTTVVDQDGANTNNRTFQSSTSSTVIKQAYVAANIIKNLKLTAGQFSTHVGYEVVESYQNPNYTLGYLFGYGPFYHTGAKLDYSLFDGKIGVMAGVTNGWDLQADNNKNKSVIGQISLKPTSAISIFLNYVGGNETSGYVSSTSNVGGMRHIGDIVIQVQLNKMLKVGVNVVYGENKVNTDTAAQQWGGAAGYLSFIPTDWLTISWRTDYLDDRKLARGFNTKVLGNTLTGTIAMYGGHFLIRPEVKYDVADNAIYGGGSELHKTNVTGLLSFTGVY
jgi:hypothetical protein